eukprot:1588445-Pyramimonas_sp.AAC.1
MLGVGGLAHHASSGEPDTLNVCNTDSGEPDKLDVCISATGAIDALNAQMAKVSKLEFEKDTSRSTTVTRHFSRNREAHQPTQRSQLDGLQRGAKLDPHAAVDLRRRSGRRRQGRCELREEASHTIGLELLLTALGESAVKEGPFRAAEHCDGTLYEGLEGRRREHARVYHEALEGGRGPQE